MSASLAGCLTVPSWIKSYRPQDNGAAAEILPAYFGPKVKIILADFAVTPARISSDTGAGLRQMLATALLNSNHFSLIERPEAGLIISVTVTEFQPQASGGSAGLGGGGGVNSGALGGLLGRPSNKAHMSLEVRIVNALTTGRILAAHKLQAQAADISGNIMNDPSGSWPLAGELSVYSRTPMEKAIRLCLAETVRYLAQKIPEEYYKY
ncbi:MAG: CsgG/HfaB family protein [Candidatus Omnitrophota bacterium]|nr:CsgG/HfaB family protein [Candidatus Omnitrophota bacterium]